MSMRNFPKKRSLRSNEDGIAAVEFGLIGSTFLVLLMGGFDLGHTMYVNTVLEGALQEASRNSALQTGSAQSQRDQLDAAVREQVQRLNANATVTFSRRFYKTFTAARDARHEQDINSTDAALNDDGICDVGESYIDVNNNDEYDTDGGDAGQGGAQDAVIYRVTVSYPRLFPMAGLLGWSEDVNVTSSTVLQNQPYSAQSQYGPATTRTCP
jgi:Flp pilus assembly protein TadG